MIGSIGLVRGEHLALLLLLSHSNPFECLMVEYKYRTASFLSKSIASDYIPCPAFICKHDANVFHGYKIKLYSLKDFITAQKTFLQSSRLFKMKSMTCGQFHKHRRVEKFLPFFEITSLMFSVCGWCSCESSLDWWCISPLLKRNWCGSITCFKVIWSQLFSSGHLQYLLFWERYVLIQHKKTAVWDIPLSYN